MALVDRRNRPPIVNRLYGGRLRITYRSDVINSVDTKAELLASVLLEPKTADSKHTECLIVSQDLAGGELNKPNTLIQVFETLTTAMVDEIQPITDTDVNARESITRTLIGQPDVDISAISIGSIYNSSYAATQIVNQSDEFRRQLKVKYLEVELSETQIGGDQRIDTENGRTAFVRTFVQLSAATYVPGDVGDISTIDSLSVALSDIKSETSGAVRTISRTYITAGKLSESTKDSSNGKLIVKSLVFFNEIPSTPSGFTLTDTSVKNPDGSPTYSYQFAKGVGRISTKESTRQKGQVKITSIQYLGADDATTPSGNLIDSDVTEKDGYVLTSQAYAEIVGTGYLVDDVQTKEGGKLILYNKVRVGSLPANPSATIGGSVVLIDESSKEEDGYTVYSRSWAEGEGRISINDEIKNGGKLLIRTIVGLGSAADAQATYTWLGTEEREQDGYTIFTDRFVKGVGRISIDTQTREQGGISLVTVRYLGTDDGSLPAGDLIKTDTEERDGYAITTKVYIDAATGTVQQSDETRNGGKLLIRHIKSYVGIPATPSGYTPTETQSVDRDGYIEYNYTFTKGTGQIDQEDDTLRGGNVLVRRIRHLVAPAAVNPIATPSLYTKIKEGYDDRDGYRIWTSHFVKGSGLISTRTRQGPVEGTTVMTNVALGTASVPTGALIESEDSEEDGYVVYTRSAVQGTITGTKYTYKDPVSVTVPGIVTPGTQAVPSGTIAVAAVQPPRTKEVMATVTVEIVTTPPVTGTPAYDIGGISCSVSFIKTDEIYVGTQVIGAGTPTTISTDIYRKISSLRQAEYRGCYLSGTTATGTQTYDTVNSESDTYTNTITTKAIGTGSTSDTSATSGILRRNARPAFTALDGTTYYEVATWSI